jgi:hypothetical protein
MCFTSNEILRNLDPLASPGIIRCLAWRSGIPLVSASALDIAFAGPVWCGAGSV